MCTYTAKLRFPIDDFYSIVIYCLDSIPIVVEIHAWVVHHMYVSSRKHCYCCCFFLFIACIDGGCGIAHKQSDYDMSSNT